MANVGLMPFMCYKHPTGEESVLKYTEVLCGFLAWEQSRT